MAENIIVYGLVSSGVYALLAVGFSLIFGVARIVNLAHTAFYMLAAYIIFQLATAMELNLYLSVFLAIIIVTIAGTISYRLVIARIRQHEATTLIVTIALAVIFQEAYFRKRYSRDSAAPPAASPNSSQDRRIYSGLEYLISRS
jgi:branched-chain amino acid transport system permease protein